MQIDLSKGESVNIFMSYMNVYQRVISVRMIKIIRWPIWVALQNSVCFFPQLPLSLFNELMDKVTKAAGLEVMCGLSNMEFYATEEMGYQPCCNLQWQRPTPSLQYGIIPQVISHHCWPTDCTGPRLLRKSSTCSHQNVPFSGYRFELSCFCHCHHLGTLKMLYSLSWHSMKCYF